MTLNLMILGVTFSLLLVFIVMYIVRKGRISVKYSMVWLLSAFLIFIVSAIPNLVGFLTRILGFQVASNMLFSIILGILIFVNISLTIIVSGQKEKTRLLIQEISLLKNKNK